MAGWRLYALALASVLGALWLAFRALGLAPVTELTLAAGGAKGGYHRIAEQYRAILAEDGITLRILETAGSVENAGLLASGHADAALLQGGVPVPEGATPAAIAALFLEPLLIFERAGSPVAPFPPDWQGRRIAVGPVGSGTRFAWSRLAGAMAISDGTNTLLPIGGAKAAQALLAGEADIAVFVAPLEAPYLSPLIRSDAVRLLELEAAEALARALPELVAVRLPAHGLDYAGGVPPEDLTLLATPARMLARADLHPALVNRLVRAAQRLHSPASRLSEEADFPSPLGVDVALDPHARALLAGGPSLWEAILPYWVAAQINRFIVLLLPVLILLVPLLRALPGLYDFAVRHRIYRHYRTLREIDLAVAEAADPPALDRLESELDAVEAALRDLKVPLPFRQTAYLAQSHLDLVRSRIAARRTSL